jgi:hypothetical protein
MTEETILQYYWDIFLSHLCEFYPLDKRFIEKYEYELNWQSLSKNKFIEWDIEFLEQYENRFSWPELAWNEKILWTEEKIERFKKRLDWYYLSRNINLPITDAFIQKYSKKLFVVEDNVHLTNSLIKKYDLRLLPANDFDSQEIKHLIPSQFDDILNKYTFHHNQQEVYRKMILPIIEKQGLENIFENKFDYSQRYYYLEPVNDDIYGLTPEFEIAGDNPFEVYREGRGLFEIDKPLVLKNGYLQEGPDRLYEVPRFRSFSYYTQILISEHVKSVLEQFRLPKHIYHEVRLMPKKITTSTKFYILQFESDTLSKDLDYTNHEFHFSYKDFENRGHGKVTEAIKDYNDLMRVKDELGAKYSPIGYGVGITPDAYRITSDLDLYSYSIYGYIIVNQYLKNALEKNFPGQMAFKSAQLLNIKIEQRVYDDKVKQQINMKLSSKMNYNQSEEDKFYYAKAERLEREDPELDASSLENDKFLKKEMELKVIFPKIFKNNYLNKAIRIKGYKLLPISKFYLQNEYADRHPETYKSVVIAENGVGDSINLILERDSDFMLQNRLFEFFHETGEYEEV